MLEYDCDAKTEDAEKAFRQILAAEPNHAEAHLCLGRLLWKRGQQDSAVACFENALAIQPDYPEALWSLGNAFWSKWEIDEAILRYQRAVAIKPSFAEVHASLGNAFKDRGQLDEAIACYRKALELDSRQTAVHSRLLLTMHYLAKYDGAAIFDESQLWDRIHTEALSEQALQSQHANGPDPARRLRIGYISADFHDHPVGRFLLPLLSTHDRKVCQVFCYAEPPCSDEVTTRLQDCADTWRNIAGLSDEQVASLVCSDQIDILVDLAGHTDDNRLLVFARKPAPIQATYLGYPDTTGLRTMDYRFSDFLADPPGQTDGRHSEKLVRLPQSTWCFEAPADAPAVTMPPALTNGYITFGCLNNFCKINSELLSLWATVLNATKGSRLLILAPEGNARECLLDTICAEGADRGAIQFIAPQPRAAYLATFGNIDISLDPFPYHGTATTCESLWMGVPVVSLAGQTHVSRVGVSLLSTVGLKDFIASTPEQYVDIASAAANDTVRLAELRVGMRARMKHSPLMDAAVFARDVEAAYRKMWIDWCKAQ